MSPPSSPTIKAAEDLELSDSPESETFEDGSDVLADHKETPSRVKTAASMGENGISSSTDQAITSPSSSFRSIPASTSLSSLSPEKLLSRLPSKTSPAGRKLRLASPKPPKNSGSATPTLSGEGFSEVPLTTKNADPEAGEHRTPERKSRAFSLVPPPPADLSYDLPEPVVTPPAKESGPSKASFFSSALGFGFPSTSASLAAEPSSLSAQTSRTASGNSQQGGWKSTMTNLLTTRPASSTSPVPPPSSSRSSPSSHPSAVSPAGPSRTPSSSFLLHRIESTTASRDRRISREAGGGDKLREGFERVRGEMEGAAREMRREREKGVEEEKEERPTSSGGVDWVFWGSVVQDYEEVARTRPKELSKAIQQGIPAVIRYVSWPEILLTVNRGAIWQLMSSSKSLPLEETYKALLKLSSPHEKAIVKDLSRTFPHHKFFQEGGGAGQESLFMVVKAYSLYASILVVRHVLKFRRYDQEVGYTQGLAFIVAALLLNASLPYILAFCCHTHLSVLTYA